MWTRGPKAVPPFLHRCKTEPQSGMQQRTEEVENMVIDPESARSVRCCTAFNVASVQSRTDLSRRTALVRRQRPNREPAG
jgi:hypothetical protein